MTPDLAEPQPRPEAMYDAGKRAWPGVELTRGRYDAFVSRRVEEVRRAASPAGALASLCAEDLYIACACADAIPGAVQAFEARYGAEIDAALRRATSQNHEDLGQTVRARLFASASGESAKIASYSGRAPLVYWVRVVAVRCARNAQRKRSEAPADDALFAQLVEPTTAEHSLIEARLVQEYKAAFEHAFAALTPSERSLLRLNVLDGLSIDDLARLLRVHRSTAARQLAVARERLAEGTRARVVESAGLTDSEWDSTVRVIRHRLELSVERIFTCADEDAVG